LLSDSAPSFAVLFAGIRKVDSCSVVMLCAWPPA
jgi:hypothetical protein